MNYCIICNNDLNFYECLSNKSTCLRCNELLSYNKSRVDRIHDVEICAKAISKELAIYIKTNKPLTYNELLKLSIDYQDVKDEQSVDEFLKHKIIPLSHLEYATSSSSKSKSIDNDNAEINTPDYNLILNECNKAVRKAYPKRGNSWKYENKEYWITRLRNEVSEFENAISHEQQQGKLINIINFCSMMHHIIDTLPSYIEYYGNEEDAKDRQEKKESMEMAEEHRRMSKVRNNE